MKRALAGLLAAFVVAMPLAAQVRGATPPATPAPAQGRGAKPDTGQAANSLAERGSRGQMTIMREVFSYSNSGRRDPMISLMTTGELRPLLTEVELITILYDELDPNRSVATLRNLTDKKTLYRVRIGQQLGRMKVAQITRREVIFTIDEFGFSRQERLSIKPEPKKGTP